MQLLQPNLHLCALLGVQVKFFFPGEFCLEMVLLMPAKAAVTTGSHWNWIEGRTFEKDVFLGET